MKKSIEQAFVRLGAHFAVLLLNLPPRLVKLIAGPVPSAAEGIHPEAMLLARLTRLPRPGGGRGLGGDTDSRSRTDIEATVFGAKAPRSVSVSDGTVAGAVGELPTRVYTPAGFAAPGPLLVFFHGGGFMSGSLSSHDSVCRMLADSASAKVVSVDYRLAPEHPYPAAADDAIAAFASIATRAEEFGADPARIAVGGDSAGGNLAAVVANESRAAAHPAPKFQLLIYPMADVSKEHETYARFAKGFFLTQADLRDITAKYTPDPADRTDPRVSPLLNADLAGVAPAFVATAIADPLRSEGEAYVEVLRAAGVAVGHQQFPLIHGFVNMTESPASFEATRAIGMALRAGLEPLQ